MRRGVLEFRVGFAGEAGHDVSGPMAAVGRASRILVIFSNVVPRTIFAVHAAEDGHRCRTAWGHGRGERCDRRKRIKAISSSVQSMGSTELRRSFSRVVCCRIASTRVSNRRAAGVRSRPQRPKLMPEITTSREPEATRLLMSSMTCGSGRERLWPRTVGMMQKEQRLLQPSWTFRLGRVRASPWSCFLESRSLRNRRRGRRAVRCGRRYRRHM